MTHYTGNDRYSLPWTDERHREIKDKFVGCSDSDTWYRWIQNTLLDALQEIERLEAENEALRKTLESFNERGSEIVKLRTENEKLRGLVEEGWKAECACGWCTRAKAILKGEADG